MLRQMSLTLSAWLFKDSADIQKAQADYGCEIFLYTMFSTLGLLFVGMLLHKITEAMLIIFVFYMLQSSGGGYHANSHIKCFTVMLGGLVAGCLLSNIATSHGLQWSMAGLSTCVLLMVPIRLHKNKFYMIHQMRYFRRQSRHVTLCLFVVFGVMSFLQCKFTFPIAYGLMAAALSRISAQ